MMESKIRKHEVKMPPSMMSNALVNVANLGAIIEGSVALMLNDLTGVPGLCEKKPRKQKSRIGSLKWPKTSYRIPFPWVCLQKVCFPWFTVFPNLRPPTIVVIVIVMAEHLEHLWVICCLFVSENPKRIDFFCIFMQNR